MAAVWLPGDVLLLITPPAALARTPSCGVRGRVSRPGSKGSPSSAAADAAAAKPFAEPAAPRVADGSRPRGKVNDSGRFWPSAAPATSSASSASRSSSSRSSSSSCVHNDVV